MDTPMIDTYLPTVTDVLARLNLPVSASTSGMGVDEINIIGSGTDLTTMRANTDAAEEALLAAGVPVRRFSVSRLYVAPPARRAARAGHCDTAEYEQA